MKQCRTIRMRQWNNAVLLQVFWGKYFGRDRSPSCFKVAVPLPQFLLTFRCTPQRRRVGAFIRGCTHGEPSQWRRRATSHRARHFAQWSTRRGPQRSSALRLCALRATQWGDTAIVEKAVCRVAFAGELPALQHSLRLGDTL